MHASDMLSRFMRGHPELVFAMEEADHNHSCLELNPYHMEGSVWTHTMMVFNNAIKKEYPTEVCLAALFHDIGKGFTREVKWSEKYGRIH